MLLSHLRGRELLEVSMLHGFPEYGAILVLSGHVSAVKRISLHFSCCKRSWNFFPKGMSQLELFKKRIHVKFERYESSIEIAKYKPFPQILEVD